MKTTNWLELNNKKQQSKERSFELLARKLIPLILLLLVTTSFVQKLIYKLFLSSVFRTKIRCTKRLYWPTPQIIPVEEVILRVYCTDSLAHNFSVTDGIQIEEERAMLTGGGGFGWKILCITVSYSEPRGTESQEESSTLTDSCRMMQQMILTTRGTYWSILIGWRSLRVFHARFWLTADKLLVLRTSWVCSVMYQDREW